MDIKKIESRLLPTSIFMVIFSAFQWGWPILLLSRFFPHEITGTLFDWFNNWQSDSDALVTARLEQNYTTGSFSYFGLLGSQGSYLSQFGFASNVLTLIPFYLGFSIDDGLVLIKLLVITFNSIFWTVLGNFMYKKFGWVSLFFFLIGLLQPWSLVANKSTYWFISLKLFPMIFLYLVYKYSFSNIKKRLAEFLFILSLLVSLLSGYEFLSITFAVIFAIFAYSQLEGNVVKRLQILNFVKLVVVLFFTTIFGLFLHFLQLTFFLGNTALSLSYLSGRFNGRILGDPSSDVTGFAASADISPRFILSKYMEMPVFGSPLALPIFRYFTVFVFICILILFFNIFQERKYLEQRLERNLQVRNVSISVFITLLGPLGWYIFAAPHSYIHFHINFILWYLPFIPLAFGLIPALYGKSFWALVGVKK